MKSFLLKLGVFSLLGLGLLTLICDGAMKFPVSFEKIGFSKDWFKLYQIIKTSEDTIASDTLFIGDSVAAQLFPPDQRRNFITTNAGVLMPGQYIIAANSIEANPNLKSIVLIGAPISIGAKFEGYLTMNGFIKPFYSKKNLEHFDQILHKKISKKPLASYYQNNLVKFLPFSDINFVNPRDTTTNYLEQFQLSDISITYLRKLHKLCSEKNIKLHILATPLNDSFRTNTSDWATLKEQIKVEKLDNLFYKYFDTMSYLSKEKFTDGAHLKPELLPIIRKEILAQIQN